ncbi:hypothetical protein L596_028027 [Steinernema carpocapsae]|uniref:Uncharacterized protein n=1 Tax=Steinernema carpocapsae TaxID=34508 RepID=A0A4U5LXA9_STECR|nr:hypothetical protein L596_028027 [Steinernema carpocapsae]
MQNRTAKRSTEGEKQDGAPAKKSALAFPVQRISTPPNMKKSFRNSGSSLVRDARGKVWVSPVKNRLREDRGSGEERQKLPEVITLSDDEDANSDTRSSATAAPKSAPKHSIKKPEISRTRTRRGKSQQGYLPARCAYKSGRRFQPSVQDPDSNVVQIDSESEESSDEQLEEEIEEMIEEEKEEEEEMDEDIEDSEKDDGHGNEEENEVEEEVVDVEKDQMEQRATKRADLIYKRNDLATQKRKLLAEVKFLRQELACLDSPEPEDTAKADNSQNCDSK